MTYSNLRELAARYTLVLGSGSPRRVELLSELGIAFAQMIPDIHESIEDHEEPYHYARRLAQDKALEIGRISPPDHIVLGCDTIVVLGDHLLEKPNDQKHAFEILRLLSGKQHVVCSAAAFVCRSNVLASGYELTKVFFNSVSDEEIESYIDTGEPMDKAGAYGIQGMGSFLVDRIEGNLDTVVGLPRTLIERLAGEALLVI
ncbi:MAG: Maf family protein [candidate division Zixibacteria bacterium]|nr:Maf family protein [candidate division Zixibacteria bacterium]